MFRCKTRQKEYLASWHQKNKERRAAAYQERYKSDPDFRARRAFYQKEYNKKLKFEVLAQYGGECRGCGEKHPDLRRGCGEKHPDLLCLDHIYGKGNQHRKQIRRNSGRSFYAWIKNENFPIEYQLLCFNCNNSKGILGTMPHKAEVHKFIRTGLGL